MPVKGVEQGSGLGFFYQRQPFEGTGKAVGDGVFIEGGKLEFGHGGVEKIDPGHELFHPVIHERKIEGSVAPGLGEAASAGHWIEVVLLRLLLDDEIVKAYEFHRGDTLVFDIKEMLHGGAQMLGKHVGNPLRLHRSGEAEQGQWEGAARGHLV